MVRKIVLSLIAVLGGGMLIAMNQKQQVSGTVTDAEKLCTFTPISSITSITETGAARAERGTDGGFGGPRGEKRENFDGTKNKENKNQSRENEPSPRNTSIIEAT